jgi:DNA-binding beta-propeller fold protein YncE
MLHQKSLAMLSLVACAGLTACQETNLIDRSSGSSAVTGTPAPATPAPATPGSGPEKPESAAKRGDTSVFADLAAPAGSRIATRSVRIDGYNAAILPNGRLLTPVGFEVNVDAPNAYGMAVTYDGKAAATINSGASRFSVSLVRNISATSADLKRIPVNATFMGVVFSPDGSRFYASGGENGNVWVGETATARIIGSVNLNGATKPLPSPSLANPFPDPARNVITSFRGSFPAAMALTVTGKYLYVLDQAAFAVHVIDTAKLSVGLDADNKVIEMNNIPAVVGKVKVGRYPFGLSLSPDDKRLYVANVGVSEFKNLSPATRTGDNNIDFPLCYPGTSYPDDVLADKTIKIKKLAAGRTISGLPTSLRDPDGIRCGYVNGDQDYTIPALGDPNADESSSIFVLDLASPETPAVTRKVKTGLKVGDVEHGITTTGGSHPNAVAVGNGAVFVSNGNHDSISVLDPGTLAVVNTFSLAPLGGADKQLRGVQPVSLALSPDGRTLYVAEAGLNSVAVLKVSGNNLSLSGRIPTGWWPSAVKLSADGRRLFVTSAKGRGAPPNVVGEVPDQNGHPKHAVFGSMQILDVPLDARTLDSYTDRVMKNNGLVADKDKDAPKGDGNNPVPTTPGVASKQVKRVVFITKENLTHDLVLGDILETRKGVMVNSDPRLALGADASPNHHELALQFSFSDNFYLEPTVSSDGHRWLVNNPTTELEETHWPADYGGKRRDSGDNAEIYTSYPGRLGFTDANGSPDPNDYPQHGTLFSHLHRNGKGFINFGEGYEFALVDEDFGTEPTGIREHVNIPMLKVLRDNSDHLFPNYNTKIPDAPLPEDPDRFSRFGRFKQVFESEYVKNGECHLPAFTYLFYPNDHGGGATDINGPTGPRWDFKRFVQDNDAALGLTVELISKSPCWKDTVIFVTEDDTQSGLDHVNGYRTLFLAIGPHIKREYVSKTHTSLASVFKTINLLLGMPAQNLYDATATDLRDMFTGVPNLSPYQYQPIPYAKVAKRSWARLTKELDFSEMDSEEVDMRRAIMLSEGLPRKVPVVFNPRKGVKLDQQPDRTPTPPAGSSLRQAGASSVQANAAP